MDFLGCGDLAVGTMVLVNCPREIKHGVDFAFVFTRYELSTPCYRNKRRVRYVIVCKPDHALMCGPSKTNRTASKTSNTTTHDKMFSHAFISMTILSTLADRTISFPTGLSMLTSIPRLAPTGHDISFRLTNSVRQRQNGEVRANSVIQLSSKNHRIHIMEGKYQAFTRGEQQSPRPSTPPLSSVSPPPFSLGLMKR